MKETCICIAGDVISSRDLNSEPFVRSLSEALKQLNQAYSKDVLIPFEVRNGDEIVGVIKRFSKGYLAARQLIEMLSKQGIHLYIGLGLGRLDNNHATVHTMNGSAVLNAFEARDNFLKKQHPKAKQWQIDTKKSILFFYAEDYPYQSLNALVYSMLEKTYSRSEKQRDVIQFIRQHPTFNYEQIGKKMGYKSPKSTISYLLSRANYHVVNAIDESLQHLLDDLQTWYTKKGG